MLKTLVEEIGNAGARGRDKPPRRAVQTTQRAAPASPGYDARQSGDGHLHLAHAAQRPGLGEGHTWHIEFDLAGSGVDYTAGDCFGIFPTNDPALVEAIIEAARVPRRISAIGGRTLRAALTDGVSLCPAPDTLFELFSYYRAASGGKKRRRLPPARTLTATRQTLDVLAAMREIRRRAARTRKRSSSALDPLQPRLYSISSSPKANPGRVSLTVDAVRYLVGKRDRRGVASTFLAERRPSRARA